MISKLEQQIINSYSSDYKFFFSKPNVIGIAYGYKYTNKVCTYIPSIHIYVTKKISPTSLSFNELIPSLYKNIKTDVIELGFFNPLNSSKSNNCISSNFKNSLKHLPKLIPNNFSILPPFIQRIRPIQPSFCMSVYLPRNPYSTGTFGYIVTDNTQKSKTYCLLSVNTTFADLNFAPIGSIITQPAYAFGGRPPMDTVATLLRFEPLKFSKDIPPTPESFNIIDASVASFRITTPIELINPFIPDIGVPNGLISPSVGQQIQWTGSIAGHQTGTIHSIAGMFKFTYGRSLTAWFKDVIMTSGFSSKGDFGCLVCDTNKNALGLLFNNISTNIFICNIKTVLQTLDVTLLTVNNK